MNTVLAYLDENRRKLDFGPWDPARLCCVAVTPRFRASSHVVFLLLAPGQADPILVAKLPRLAGRCSSLEQTAANLRAVQARRPGGFDSIPRVLAFEEYRGRPILLSTALAGSALEPAVVRRDPKGACADVLAWLGQLQYPQGPTADVVHKRGQVPSPTTANARKTHPGEVPVPVFEPPAEDDWFERLIQRPLDLFGRAFPHCGEEAACLARTAELAAALREAKVPAVFEHGDFSSPNILRLRDGRIGVVDWELAEPRGLPAQDVFFFLTYMAFALGKASTPERYASAFHAAFFGESAWTRPYVLDYARRIGLPPELLSPLLVLCWIRYLTTLLRRIDEAVEAGEPVSQETAAWLRSNRYYALWRHSLAHVEELRW